MKQDKTKKRSRIADETPDDILHLLPLTLVLIKERLSQRITDHRQLIDKDL